MRGIVFSFMGAAVVNVFGCAGAIQLSFMGAAVVNVFSCAVPIVLCFMGLPRLPMCVVERVPWC